MGRDGTELRATHSLYESAILRRALHSEAVVGSLSLDQLACAGWIGC